MDKPEFPLQLHELFIQYGTVFKARMSPARLAENQMARLMVAAGGNLRGLFALALDAMRAEYRRRLGQNPYDPDALTYEDKQRKLRAVYNQEPDSDIPDAAFYSLLRARAIQEFNGEGWYGRSPADSGHLESARTS